MLQNNDKFIELFKLTDGDSREEWEAGFDTIDIAPKDGKLSDQEIVDYRKKQMNHASRKRFISPRLWFNRQFDYEEEIHKKETRYYDDVTSYQKGRQKILGIEP